LKFRLFRNGAAYLRYAVCGFTRAREYKIRRVDVKRARFTQRAQVGPSSWEQTLWGA
jgi:hypothetical protein